MKNVKHYLIVLCLFLPLSSHANNDTKKTPEEIMPITAANIRGHEALYREGWFVVSSSEKALRYAKQRGIIATGDAMSKLQRDLVDDTKKFGQGLAKAGESAATTTAKTFQSGTETTKNILSTTHVVGSTAWELGNESMLAAWDAFLLGNLSLVQRTEEDRAALTAIPGDYFKNMKSDFRDLHEFTQRVKESTATHIEGKWQEAFDEAKDNFNRSYEKSGQRSNSLLAVGDILTGYLNVIYSGLLKPASRSVVQGGEVSVKTASKIIFLPVASLFIVSGRTVQSVGLSLYYTTALGVSLVSPTVEGGLLAGLSLLSYGATPVTYTAGATLGAVNQVVITAAAPTAGVATSTARASAKTIEYAALVSYDVIAGTTKVAINQTSAGVALGYNALTALPTQLALAAANSVVFLAWDGPRLVVASAKGEVKWTQGNETRSMSLQDLPVGSVVNMRSLSNSSSVETTILSDDPDVVNAILEKLPDDLRTGDSK